MNLQVGDQVEFTSFVHRGQERGTIKYFLPLGDSPEFFACIKLDGRDQFVTRKVSDLTRSQNQINLVNKTVNYIRAGKLQTGIIKSEYAIGPDRYVIVNNLLGQQHHINVNNINILPERDIDVTF